MSGKSNVSLRKVLTFQDSQELARGAAEYLANRIHQALVRQGLVSLMLSGGSTPRDMYSYLASPDLAGQIDWGRVHVFWSDERCVPPDHGDSNYNMARQCLLDLVPISADNIHRVHGELDPLAAADAYELALRGFFGDARVLPCMDFILLGMGEDGHIASLFPGDAALDESRRWIVAVPHDRPPPPMVWRVTATLPFIRSARQVILIVSGASKAARVQQALSEKADAPLLPVQRLREIEGELVWMLDRVAAGLE